MISPRSTREFVQEEPLASPSEPEARDASPLVSIITPCFNGEQHVGRMIESLLAQTYPRIEFILVNDGSTDGTEDVINSYRSRLDTDLARFVYVIQPNAGLGGAINGGLPHVTGEYLCWPDADDFLEPTSVAERVEVLEKSPGYALVTSDAYLRKGSAAGEVIGRIAEKHSHNDDPDQFEYLLRGDSIFTSGCHMVRMSVFDETHPGRQIYPAKRGQNWQMLLPIYFRHKRSFLDRPLYNYVVSDSSMSRGDLTSRTQRARAAEHRDIRLKTLAAIPMTPREREKWEREVEKLYHRALVHIAFTSRDLDAASEAYRELQKLGDLEYKERLRFRVKLALTRLSIGRAGVEVRDADDGGSSRAEMTASAQPQKHLALTTSVLVTTYNGVRFVEEQLLSILHQSRPVDQVLICDDGSSDGTVERIREFLAEHHPAGWSLLVNDPNLGPALNVLTHISALTGEVVFLSDQDDVWEVDKVKVMTDYMVDHPETALAVSRTSLIDARGEILDARTMEAQSLKNSRIRRGATKDVERLDFNDFIGYSTVPLHAMCVRGTVLRRITESATLPELSLSLGPDWYIGIWSVTLGDSVILPDVLVRRRVHDANISLGRLRKTTLLASTGDKRLAMLREVRQAHLALLSHDTLSQKLTDGQEHLIVSMCDFLERRIDFAANPSLPKALGLVARGGLYVRSASRVAGGARVFGADVMYAYNINWRQRRK